MIAVDREIAELLDLIEGRLIAARSFLAWHRWERANDPDIATFELEVRR